MNNIEICEQIIEDGHCDNFTCEGCPLNNKDEYDCDEYPHEVKAAWSYLEHHEQFTKAEAIKRMANGEKVYNKASSSKYYVFCASDGLFKDDSECIADLNNFPFYGWKVYRTKKVKKYFWTAKTIEDYFVTVGPYSIEEEAINASYNSIPLHIKKDIEWISKLEESEIIEEIA